MRAFQILVVLIAVITLLFMPLTQGIYDFKTDIREDVFNNVHTNSGVVTANVTILKTLYDSDTSTFSITSNTSVDTPVYSSYNSTSRQLLVSGLAANTYRTLYVEYDIDALSGATVIDNLMDFTPYLWYLLLIIFIPVAIIAIWTGRA